MSINPTIKSPEWKTKESYTTKKIKVLGIGTGRCGTKSLAHLIDKHLPCSHERKYRDKKRPSWDVGKEVLKEIISYFQSRPSIGEVGLYYISYIEELLKVFPAMKIVCIRRNKKDTVESMDAWFKSRRPFIQHNNLAIKSRWYNCYPKFDTKDHIKSMEMYWDAYYNKAETLHKKYPQNVKIFDIEQLNSKEGQQAILDFIGIPRKDQIFLKELRIGVNITKAMKELWEKIAKAMEPYQGIPVALSGGIDSSLLAALIKPKFVISVQLPDDRRFNEIEYAKIVAKHLKLKHIIVEPDASKFDEYTAEAVRAIGRPIPHFNIFPLYVMYQKLQELGEKELILGDGPDETMCGYARDLIIHYLYQIYDFEAFKNYKPLIDKILQPLADTITAVTGQEFESVEQTIYGIIRPIQAISKVNVELMREDMDDMSNSIARYFGITNHRPYQDNEELDKFMYNLPIDLKIKNTEYGKYALRIIAHRYLPKQIAWRKKKVGGPVYPVNKLKGWLDNGEFDKTEYLKWQKHVLAS